MVLKFELVLATSVFLGVFASAKDPKDSADTLAKACSPVTEDGLQLVVELSRMIDVGKPIALSAKVHNKGNEIATARYDRLTPINVHLEIVDQDGGAVPYTQFGQRHFDPKTPEDRAIKFRASLQSRTIQPGNSASFSVENIGLFYDLTLPGEYHISVKRNVLVGEGPVRKRVELKSELLSFWIQSGDVHDLPK